MILETTFRMPNGHRPLGADGQGRVIGFVVLDHYRLARAIVIHLDHPDTVMESDIHPSVYHTRVSGPSSRYGPAIDIMRVSSGRSAFRLKAYWSSTTTNQFSLAKSQTSRDHPPVSTS
jgi:hypothetical protein